MDSSVSLRSMCTFKHICLKLLERTSQTKYFASSLKTARMLTSHIFKPMQNYHNCHYCYKAKVMKWGWTGFHIPLASQMLNTLLELLSNYSTKQASKQKNQPKETVLLLLHSHNVCLYFSPMDALVSDHNSEKPNKSCFSIVSILHFYKSCCLAPSPHPLN